MVAGEKACTAMAKNIFRAHIYRLSPSLSLKARSHDPILRIQFLVIITGSKRSDGPISRFRFCGENVGRSFVVFSC